MRDIYGVVMINEGWKPFRITVWGSTAKNVSLKLFTPCEFRAIPKGEENGWLRLGLSTHTVFTKVDLDVDIPSVLNAIFPLRYLKRIPQFSSTFYPQLFDVVVSAILLRVFANGSRKMYVFDDSLEIGDDEVGVFIPPHLEINFGEGDRILLLAVPRVYERDDRVVYYLEAVGIYPLETNRTEVSEEYGLDNEDSLSIEWVDE